MVSDLQLQYVYNICSYRPDLTRPNHTSSHQTTLCQTNQGTKPNETTKATQTEQTDQTNQTTKQAHNEQTGMYACMYTYLHIEHVWRATRKGDRIPASRGPATSGITGMYQGCWTGDRSLRHVWVKKHQAHFPGKPRNDNTEQGPRYYTPPVTAFA